MKENAKPIIWKVVCVPGTPLSNAEDNCVIYWCIFHKIEAHLFFSPYILDILILEVFCRQEGIGKGVFITRCNLVASLDFNNILGEYFK